MQLFKSHGKRIKLGLDPASLTSSGPSTTESDILQLVGPERVCSHVCANHFFGTEIESQPIFLIPLSYHFLIVPLRN